MFSPPFSRSPIIVVFFTLAILLSQMKLKVILFTWSQNFSGTGSTDVLKINFERQRDFTILIFPNRVKFRLFQLFEGFPKHLIYLKKLVCHPFFCILKSKNRFLWPLKGERGIFSIFPFSQPYSFWLHGVDFKPWTPFKLFQKVQQYVLIDPWFLRKTVVIRILHYSYFTGSHCDAFDFRILFYCKC